MADVSEVPIIEVHSGNFKEIYPSLVLAIQSSTFIAIDAELSGLGDRRQLMAKGIEERYKAVSEVAKTRSLISLGLSCFKQSQTSHTSNVGQTLACNVDATLPRDTDLTLMSNGDSTFQRNIDSALPSHIDSTLPRTRVHHSSVDGAVGFTVQTFNILIMCSESYVVEPGSIKFLLEHGFDFNRQYALGLPYNRGNDKLDDPTHQSLRQIFTHIIHSSVPLVLHNAFVDLVFLYESFYATLPLSMSSFLADCSQIFSAGVWDTKYIAEFVLRMQASYLEYAFRKSLRDNSGSACVGRGYADIKFLSYSEPMTRHIIYSACGLNTQPCSRDIGKDVICKAYASHGWCATGARCRKSHDVDMILDAEEWVISSKTKKKRTRVRHRHGQGQREIHTNTDESESDDVGDVSDNDTSDDVADSPHVNQLENNVMQCVLHSTHVDQQKNNVIPNDSYKIHVNEHENNVKSHESHRTHVNQSEDYVKSCENEIRSVSPCHINVNQLNFAETTETISETKGNFNRKSDNACNGSGTNEVLNNNCNSHSNNPNDIHSSIHCHNRSNSPSTIHGSNPGNNPSTIHGSSRGNNLSVIHSNPNNIPSNSDSSSQNRAVGHRAGFDAFMTGYIFAAYAVKYTVQNTVHSSSSTPAGYKSSGKKIGTQGASKKSEARGSNTQADNETQRSGGRNPADDNKGSIDKRLVLPEEFSNRIYLSGKDFPLHIVQSNFAKCSKAHLEKWKQIWKDRGDC